jgi:hypothetical protein
MAVMLCALRSVEAAEGERHEATRSSLIAIFLPSPIPVLRVGNGNPLARASLAFTVSVCLADVEYSIACWERGLAEAAKRLEQIYLDDYVTRRAAGSLKVWFSVATERSEQLRFLREAEERAIKTVAAKLQSDQRITSQMISPGTNFPTTNPPEEHEEPEDPVRLRTQQVQKWREDASIEARRGTNWSHDWSSKTHLYQIGLALHELAHIGNRNRSGN